MYNCISLVVFGSDVHVHCFSCFGYDEDGHRKCHSRESGELFVRKCSGTNSTRERPACIKFTASYHVNQWIQDKVEKVVTTVHGLHCGMRQLDTSQCNKEKCPNFWQRDVFVETCDVSCCDGSDKDCKFPLPTQDDIDRHYKFNKIIPGPGVNPGEDSIDPSAGMGARISWSVWLQAASFALFGWFKLWSPWCPWLLADCCWLRFQQTQVFEDWSF